MQHHRQRSGGGGGKGWKAGLPVPLFGAENIASNITCGIGDITAHIYCAQTAQELPKKHHEAGLPEQLPNCPFKNLSGLVLMDLR